MKCVESYTPKWMMNMGGYLAWEEVDPEFQTKNIFGRKQFKRLTLMESYLA